MKEKWYSFSGYAVFDHMTHKFWHRNQIKELAVELWENMDMNTVKKNPNNKDLSYIINSELYCFTDAKTYKNKYWDDEARWELIELPYNIGFGIIEGDKKRFIELVNEYKEYN